MKSKKKVSDHERDMAFEVPDLPVSGMQPGFRPAEALPEGASADDQRFPRISDDKDVPAESVARRLRRLLHEQEALNVAR